ncbi:hypothetical protein OEZ86_009574 [Tetradesmus obliquus]|uniref:GED domain-containing protein n=1 Tax=Tetradesmus obliquus TaxID=3088 RepID=A0ABY8UMH4_TETOB|nr:hypothetical protein OEZ85_001019 [Tetradesmus obliquus]WIA43043.1 hypothetical protein OEZ86_009574 [Tetradesmus obliquus]
MEELELLLAQKKQKSEGQEGLLRMIAGTLAYFKVASKRVIDEVPLHLKHFLLRRYCKELDELLVKRAAAASTHGVADGTALEEAAAAGEDEVGEAPQQPTAEQLMAEDASTAELRAHLQRQLKQLQKVRKILESF